MIRIFYFFRYCTVVLGLLGFAGTANATVIDFDDLITGQAVDDQYLAMGADFNNTATVLEENPLFPANSGTLLTFDVLSGGITPAEIRIDAIGGLWASAGGFVTSMILITLQAFDLLDNPIGMIDSLPNDNSFGSGTGIDPNHFLSVTAPDIAYVIFSNNSSPPAGNSFTLDDFTFNRAVAVPLSSTLLLFALGIGLMAGRRRLF